MLPSKYLMNTYLYKFVSKVTKVIKKDSSLAVYCDDTIFYPQGGGQPCDLGTLVIDDIVYQVYHTEKTDEVIAHIVESNPSLLSCVGKLCTQCIDIKRRLINAEYHSAGHLLAHLCEEWDKNLSPVKGHHYPDGAYIELIENERNKNLPPLEWLNEQLDNVVNKSPRKIQSSVSNVAEVQTLRPRLSGVIPQSPKAPIWMIAINGFVPPLPCGGTHVKDTSELKGLRVTRIKRKKGRIKVNYTFVE